MKQHKGRNRRKDKRYSIFLVLHRIGSAFPSLLSRVSRNSLTKKASFSRFIAGKCDSTVCSPHIRHNRGEMARLFQKKHFENGPVCGRERTRRSLTKFLEERAFSPLDLLTHEAEERRQQVEALDGASSAPSRGGVAAGRTWSEDERVGYIGSSNNSNSNEESSETSGSDPSQSAASSTAVRPWRRRTPFQLRCQPCRCSEDR